MRGLQDVFEPNLEQGGNIIVLVRCAATGDTTVFASTTGAVPDGPRG